MPRVLVFESDRGFAHELNVVLGQLGCEVAIVEDGAVGVELAARQPPDLILLSVELPRVNGFSVCNKIKKDPALALIPLIIMSTDSSDETFEQHKRLRTHAQDYVRKPIATGELLEHIRPHLALEGVDLLDVPISIGDVEFDAPVEFDALVEAAVAADSTLTNVGRIVLPKPAVEQPRSAVPRPGPVAGANVPRSAASEAQRAGVEAFVAGAFDRLAAPFDDEEKTMMLQMSGQARPSSAASRSSKTVPPPKFRPAADATLPVARLDVSRPRDAHDAQLAGLKAQAADAVRLRPAIEALTAVGQPSTAATSSQEFLELRESLSARDSELARIQREYSSRDRELVEANSRIRELERDARAVAQRRDELERQTTELESRLASLKTEAEVANRAREASEERARKLGEEGASLAAQERASSLHREEALAALMALEAERDSERKKHAAEFEKAVHAATQAAVQKASEEAAAALERLHRTHESELAATTLQAAESLAAREKELAQQKGNAAQAQDAAAQWDIERQMLEANVEALTSERDTALGELESERARTADAEQKLAKRTLALEKLEDRFSDAVRKAASLEAELVQARDGLRAIEDARKNESNAIEAKLVAAETRARELSSDLERSVGEVDALRGQLLRADAEVARAASALTEQRAKLDRTLGLQAKQRALIERAKIQIVELVGALDDGENSGTD